jgi:hypothetical protein
VIALWLGHEPVDTTAIYLHADLRATRRAGRLRGLARRMISGAYATEQRRRYKAYFLWAIAAKPIAGASWV